MVTNLPYNPYKEMDTPVWDVYKGLSKQPFDKSFEKITGDSNYSADAKGVGRWGWKENDLLLRFMILYVDPKSPYHRLDDFDYRKKVILKEFVQDHCKVRKDSKLVYEILEENEIFEKFLFWYFIILNGSDYEHWFSLKVLERNVYKKIRDANAVADASLLKATLSAAKEINNIKAEVSELEVKLFKDPLVKSKLAEKAVDPNAGWAERFAGIGFAEQRTKKRKSEEEILRERAFKTTL